ncbi:hypothetical protein [Nonomuraea sp. NPDC005650]|uniref:hypothetical protein n=1 Tax=Nonomuraea sp. NPDC005650 TaxID=3157045 RepID=UPI0033A5495A
MTTAKHLPNVAWEKALTELFPDLSETGPAMHFLRQALADEGLPETVRRAFIRGFDEAVQRYEAFETIRPLAYEAYLTKDQALAPSGLTHAQKLLLIRFQVFMVAFIAMYGIISAHEDQADKLSLYLGGGALPVAWWCARKVVEQYDKRYGPDQTED